jgi:hypothetical protein
MPHRRAQKITRKTKQPYQTKEVKKWDQEVMRHDVVTYDEKAASSQRVLANLVICQTTKGANATQ